MPGPDDPSAKILCKGMSGIYEYRYISVKYIREGKKTLAMENLFGFFREIFHNFMSMSLQMRIVLLTLILFLVFLSLLSAVRKHRLRRTYVRKLNEIYTLLLNKFDIQEDEKQLLDAVGEFQENPEDKYLLLLDSSSHFERVSRGGPGERGGC